MTRWTADKRDRERKNKKSGRKDTVKNIGTEISKRHQEGKKKRGRRNRRVEIDQAREKHGIEKRLRGNVWKKREDEGEEGGSEEGREWLI